MGVQLTYAEIK